MVEHSGVKLHGVENTLMRWYVVSCYFLNQANIVSILEKEIAKEGLSSLVGQIRQFYTEHGDSRQKKLPKQHEGKHLFPGYLFVQAKLNSYLMNLILGIQGVRKFLGRPGHPTPLSYREVKRFIQRINAPTNIDQGVDSVPFGVGDYVRITSANLQGLECQIIKMNYSAQVATVYIELFGRMTATDIDFKDCQKVF